MPKEKNTKTHNIFLLNKEKAQELLFSNEETSIDEIISKIMAKDHSYREQVLKPLSQECDFQIKLFFNGEKRQNNRLASFCSPFVREDQEILKFSPQNASSVLFVWSEEHIFVITTGQGFRIVEDFCTPKFGLIVISIFEKLFKITALDSNGMSSIVHSSKTIYSNEVDFVDVESLDTVFKEVTGRLNSKEKVHDLLNLNETSNKKSIKITGKNYVQFSSSLDFFGLIHLLSILDKYDFSSMKDSFNLIVPLSLKRSPAEISANNRKVIEMLYNNLSTEKDAPFDLFNKSTSDFIGADTYAIVDNNSNESLSLTDDIQPNIFIIEAFTKYLKGKEANLENFISFIDNVKIYSYKNENVSTCGSILEHISGEMERDGKNYYIFYGEYYCLSESYSERLNRSLRGKLSKEKFVDILHTIWEKDEDTFNKTASENEGLVHLHKVKPDYIEFADLMKVEDSVITLFHIKDGFDCDMRALDRQVELSVTRIIDAKSNNNVEYLCALYENALRNKVGKNIKTEFATEKEFIEAMIHREIKYVVGIHPPQADLFTCKSNIAKHCLNALILRCFNQGIDLKIDILR